MNKTWASGAIELLDHANSHMHLDTAFDKRIAFISIDNAVEIAIKNYLSLPKQFFNKQGPSRKELDECFNNFTEHLVLLLKYERKNLIGINEVDIEFYHRLRNTLYHQGTGLGVDQEHLNAYFIIAKLLLKQLYGIPFKAKNDEALLEKIILNWSKIEEKLSEVVSLEILNANDGKLDKELLAKGLSKKAMSDIKVLRSRRNQIVHSKEIDTQELLQTFKLSELLLNDLENEIQITSDNIKGRNFFYEPDISEIRGKLTLNSFFGPPSYGETPEDDYLENVWILTLEEPINVHQVKSEFEEGEVNSTEFNVSQIQLNADDLTKYVDKSVVLKGGLWQAHTAHHYTPVLMSVKSIKEL